MGPPCNLYERPLRGTKERSRLHPLAGSSEEVRQIQEYLWDLYLSYDRTRSAALALHHWADKEGQGQAVLVIPPESAAKKPPWPKPRPSSP